MHNNGYNIVIFVGKGDNNLFETILNAFPIHYCLTIAKQKKFVPVIDASEHEWRHLYQLDDIDWNNITPLDGELVESMRSCETIVLEIYSRLEAVGKVISYQERKRAYLQVLRYCNHILDKKSIDLLLLPGVPHHPISYTFYSLCKQKGISVLFPYHADPLVDAFHIQDDWEKPAPTLELRFTEMRLQGIDSSRLSFSASFEEYWNTQTGGEKKQLKSSKKALDPRPWYMTYKRSTPLRRWYHMVVAVLRSDLLRFLWLGILFIPRRLSPSFLRVRIRRFFCFRRTAHIFRFYDVHAQKPDLTIPYVYVPLQLQPECTSLPMGGAYVDQILIVQMLNMLLPEDVYIYVKEHPSQFKHFPDGRGRTLGLYSDILACSKVRLIRRDEDSYRLIDNAIAVATITGTCGLEALFREKPVLLFGHRFYQYGPGVYMVHTIDDCKKAIDDIFIKNAKPTLDEVRLFLKAVEETAYEGTVGFGRFVISSFSKEENAQRASNAFIVEIEKRFGWKRKIENIPKEKIVL